MIRFNALHRSGATGGSFPAGGDLLRRGVTLIEVILVVTLLSAMAALSYPSIDRMLIQLSMNEAVAPVRNHLAGSRIRALDAGLTWQFRFEPGGRRYLAVPYEFEEIDGDEQQQQAQIELLRRVSGQLPEGYSFTAADDATSSTEALNELAVSGLSNESKLMETTWSSPVLFYSDGTATTASFDVVDEALRSRRFSVRALTGGVRVADPLAEVKR